MATYKPPRGPGFFSSQEAKEQHYKERAAYDRAWEAERARQDYRKK